VITNSVGGPANTNEHNGRIETMRVDVPGVGWP